MFERYNLVDCLHFGNITIIAVTVRLPNKHKAVAICAIAKTKNNQVAILFFTLPAVFYTLKVINRNHAQLFHKALNSSSVSRAR